MNEKDGSSKKEYIKKYMSDKLELDKLNKNIEISTMTINCSLDLTFNRENIAKYIPLTWYGIRSVAYGNPENKNTNRSLIPMKKKKRKNKIGKKKNTFSNQVSMYIYSKSKALNQRKRKKKDKKIKDMINVKLFGNGAIHMTGCNSIENIEDIFNILVEEFKHVKAIIDYKKRKIIEKPFTSDISVLSMNNIQNFKISLVNSDFVFPEKIDLNNFHKLLLNKKIDCKMNIEKHACVNINFTPKTQDSQNNDFPTDSKETRKRNIFGAQDDIDENDDSNSERILSIFVFAGGSIVITSAKSCSQINEAYTYINKLLLLNYQTIRKNTLA